MKENYLNLPPSCLSTQLPICPHCNDTKRITADKGIKLGGTPYQVLTCTKCCVSWDMRYDFMGDF